MVMKSHLYDVHKLNKGCLYVFSILALTLGREASQGSFSNACVSDFLNIWDGGGANEKKTSESIRDKYQHSFNQWKIGDLGWWFGVRIGVPLSHYPFHKGIPGIQTTNLPLADAWSP